MVASASWVSVLVMVWTLMGASPPTRSLPDPDLAGLAALDVLVGAIAHGGSGRKQEWRRRCGQYGIPGGEAQAGCV
jgi:hypothetical protein